MIGDAGETVITTGRNWGPIAATQLALHGCPLVLVGLLLSLQWPQLARPTAISLIGMSLAGTVASVATLLGVALSNPGLNAISLRLIAAALDPGNLAILVAGFVIGRKLINVSSRYFSAVPTTEFSASRSRRLAGVGSLGLSLVYTIGVVVLCGLGGISAAFVATPANQQLIEGQKHIQDGRWQDAAQSFERAAADPRVAANALVALSSTNLQQQQFEEGIQNATKAIELNPQLALAYANRAYGHCGLKNFEQAISDANRALQLDPRLSIALVNRANAHLGMRQFAAAYDDANAAIAANPEQMEAFLNRGLASLNLGKPDAAVQDFEHALQLAPAYEPARANLKLALVVRAESLAVQGPPMLNRVIGDCTRALDIDPNFVPALSLRGGAYLDADRLDECEADVSRAIQLNDRWAPAYTVRGAVHLRAGRLDECIADCTKSIELAPKLSMPYLVRRQAYIEKGDSPKAEADQKMAIEISPALKSALQPTK